MTGVEIAVQMSGHVTLLFLKIHFNVIMKKLYSFCQICVLFLPLVANAWNSIGHKVIADIAWDQLTPVVKQNLRHDIALFARRYHQYPSLGGMAVWPDRLIGQDDHRYDTWHYIDIPLGETWRAQDPSKAPNVVWAIEQAKQVMADPKTKPAKRVKYEAFLVHFVGDLHQPLHCAEWYSAQFPQGDRGGNAFMIHADHAKNLHTFWDHGVGYFAKFSRHYPPSGKQIRKIATHIEQQYPRERLQTDLKDKDVMHWAAASHQLAKSVAYPGIHINQTIKKHSAYVQKGQAIVEKQLALAGYRLGDLLNHLII
ncbi:MAG: nuclease [marine bacterium B5-7]|nr:MAG: nuclease [marine bacterium B5-7]